MRDVSLEHSAKGLCGIPTAPQCGEVRDERPLPENACSLILKEIDDVGHGDFSDRSSGHNGAGAGAGYQVEAVRDFRTEGLLDFGQDLGGVNSPDAAAVQREYAEAAIRIHEPADVHYSVVTPRTGI